MSGPTLDGSPLSLTKLGGYGDPKKPGKVLVINFWASWCAPCRAEMPALAKINEETRSKGIEFAGVNLRDDKVAAGAFVRNHGVSFRSLTDTDGRLILNFRDIPPNTIPGTLIVDRRGRVAARIIGPTTYSGLTELLRKIDDTLSSSP